MILGFDGNWEENWQFIPFGAITNLNPKGQKDNSRQTVTTTTFDYNGTVIWDATDDMRFNSSFGTQVFNRNTDIVSAEGEDFPAPGVETVSAAGVTMAEETREEDTTLGFYLQEQMAWKNRLFLTAAIRFDDNSAFGKDFSAEKYPKVSASWVISEEPWWQWDFVNALKLRGAWGKAGLQPAAFSADRTLEAVAIKAGTPTVSTDQVGNADLGPETSREIEVGFDAGFWNDRIGLELTYYDKVTDDALVDKRIPPSTGFGGTQLFNIGELKNSGWEIGLSGLLVDTETVDYSFSLNYTTNENEVTSLGGEAGFALGFDQRVEEGFPVDGLWGRMPTIGADGSVTLSDEKEFYGRVTPGNYGNWGSTITLWDNLQIYSLFEWKNDLWAHNTTEEFRWIFASMRERWDPDLTDSDYAKIVGALVGGSEPIVEKADFWKWRELSFTWTMPDSWAQMLRSRRASLTFSGRNLKTCSDYRGIDPESNYAGATDLQYEDFLTVPQARRWLITTNLTF
jgi:outer membrane receptor protein involved in Fe transport